MSSSPRKETEKCGGQSSMGQRDKFILNKILISNLWEAICICWK